MTELLLKQLTSLVEFLGKALGPDYEVTLHDLESRSIVAIANGRISGRNVGGPLLERGLKLLEDKEYENSDHTLNRTELLANGKTIRASTLFFKDENGDPVAMLCINFDDSRFRSIHNDLMSLIHPESFLNQHYSIDTVGSQCQANAPISEKKAENIHNDVTDMMKEIFDQVACNINVPMDRLTQEERTDVIAQFNELGMFRLKGAVQFVAERLACSQASIYRYLSKVKYREPLNN